MRAVLRHQILEGPAVVEAGKLIVGHVDLEGVPSWTAVTDAQSRRAESPLREQLHRERADRLEAALEEEERSKVRGALRTLARGRSRRPGLSVCPGYLVRSLPEGRIHDLEGYLLTGYRIYDLPDHTVEGIHDAYTRDELVIENVHEDVMVRSVQQLAKKGHWRWTLLAATDEVSMWRDLEGKLWLVDPDNGRIGEL